MAERGLYTGKINYSIHDTVAVIIKVGQKMSYLHDFHYASFVVGKGTVYLTPFMSHICIWRWRQGTTFRLVLEEAREVITPIARGQ